MKKLLATGILSLAMVATLSGCSSSNSNTSKTATKSIGKTITRDLSSEKFTNLTIDTDDTDIVFKKGSDYKVTYSGGKKLLPLATQNGNSLTIKENESTFFNIDYHQKTPKITITMPETALNNLSISNGDGDVSGGKLSAETATLSSEDGDITLDGLTTKNGKIKLSDGDLVIDKLKTSKGYDIKTEDGDVEVHKLNATGLSLKTEDGDIRVGSVRTDNSTYKKKANSKNVLNVSTADGDIDIN